MTDKKLYKAWWAMKDRCNNISNKSYRNYGARGIRVCKEWENSFENFAEWSMSNGYTKDTTIDRIDNNGNYSPGNCRWASYKTQNRNRRLNRSITYNGKTQCVSAWAEELGIGDSALRGRLEKGWPIEKALDPHYERPMTKDGQYSKNRIILFQGKVQSIEDWSKETGVSIGTILQRIRKREGNVSALFDIEAKCGLIHDPE